MFYKLSYILIVLALSAVAYGIGKGISRKRYAGAIAALCIVLIGAAIYHFGLSNFIARHYGGTITVKIPEITQMVNMTWKESSLWVLYYIPETNTCVFKENSPIGFVEGEVLVPNCNPIGVRHE